MSSGKNLLTLADPHHTLKSLILRNTLPERTSPKHVPSPGRSWLHSVTVINGSIAETCLLFHSCAPDSPVAFLEKKCHRAPDHSITGSLGRSSQPDPKPHPKNLTLSMAPSEREDSGGTMVKSSDLGVGRTSAVFMTWNGSKKLLSRLRQRIPDRRSSSRKDPQPQKPGEYEKMVTNSGWSSL